jgi:hypothetical protein
VVVCDTTLPDDDVDAVALVAPVEVVEVAPAPFVLVAAIWVVVVSCPSRHAIAPPSESMAATLRAVAALRAPAARGARRGRGVAVAGSSMVVTLRMAREWSARGR